MFTSTSASPEAPLATVDVPAPYKIIGGGAAVSTGDGDILVSSYPTNFTAANADGSYAPTRWTAWSKWTRSAEAQRTAVTVYALAIADPENKYNVRVFSPPKGDAAEIPPPKASVSAQSHINRQGLAVDLLWL